ncbi:MAG: sulfatase-like hydrolase/transferase [Pseudomonadota bacterium]
MNHHHLFNKTVCPAWYATFMVLSWLHMLWQTYGFFAIGLPHFQDGATVLFHISAWFLYSFLYLLPVWLLLPLFLRVAGRQHPMTLMAAWSCSSLVLLLIKTDQIIYDLYAFHINRFVLNLVFTPGGISSLGSSSHTYFSITLIVLQVAGLQLLFLLISRYGLLFCVRYAKATRWTVSVIVGLFVLQGTVYGISDFRHFGPVLDSSKVYPLFRRVRFRTLAHNLGFTPLPETLAHQEMMIEQGNLRYPLEPVTFKDVPAPPNIIILVAESLRWDQLNEAIMPNTWRFGNQNQRFTQHFSSGNGTREGLFGMFYGLYGSYWESYMHARQSPLLMDRIQALDYQLDIRTSATFTYPEFDKTLFAHVPAQNMHTADEALPPWRRDEVNTDQLLAFLDHQNTERPFMSFMFFESSHAGYSFPEASALFTAYESEMDYTRLSKSTLATNIEPLFNRYHNAAHWLDIQLGRIYQKLEDEQLLGNTIVIVTGDHGEEFMEHGAWGHNSSFVEQQTHVPLVIHMPATSPSVTDTVTSHLDLGTTLLQELGAEGPSQSYSLGRAITSTQLRPFIVLSDWHSISVQTADLKYRIPYLNSGNDYWAPTDMNDRPLDAVAAATLVGKNQASLLDAIKSSSLFYAEH